MPTLHLNKNIKRSNHNAIASKINETGLEFTASKLSPKIPCLKSLKDLVLISLRKDKEGNNTYLLPTLFADNDDFVVCLPDLNRSVCDKFKVESWQIGEVNVSTLKIQDIILEGAIACTKDTLDEIRSEYDGQIEGEGTDTLNPFWLKQKPQIELPLRTLPVGEPLDLIQTDKRSRKYSTLMVNFKDKYGRIYQNVLTNAALRNLINSGCKKLMVKEIVPIKKDKIHTDKVILTPLDGADFSDFAI